LLPFTLLVFKTLRVGFPTARVIVDGNNLIGLALDAVTVTAANVGSSGLPIGSITCNVKLTNPTPTQLAASVAGRLNKFGQPLPSPVGLDSISGCVPLNAFGQGNVSQAARDYLIGDKWGISNVHQDFAEVLLTGKVFEGWAGPVSAAIGATYRAEDFKQRAYLMSSRRVGPPPNAPALGIRGIPSGFTGGSPNVFQFSTVPPIGRIRREGSVRRGERADVQAGLRATHGCRPGLPSSRYSNVGTVAPTRPASISPSTATRACAARIRATCVKPRSPNASTSRARAAR
jgi:hypothetical protein